jgi:hypothetical protein
LVGELVCERVNVWVSYESLGDCVGEHASGCMYARVGNWQSGRILTGVDEGRVGKRAEILGTGCENVELHLSHLKKIATLFHLRSRHKVFHTMRVTVLIKNKFRCKVSRSQTRLNAKHSSLILYILRN